jgi:UDP-glucose 4-epimerase
MVHPILFDLRSVLDLLKAIESACGRSIPYKIGPRRVGDVASLYANPERSKVYSVLMLHARTVSKRKLCDRLRQLLLGWEAKRELQDMANDLWRWQQQNPEGYVSSV